MTSRDDIIVRVPARSDTVHILRSVVSSVAARMHFDYESIDDLRLAVDEACAHLLAARPEASAIVLRVETAPARIAVTTARVGEAEVWPPTGARKTLAWHVLNALTDEARFIHSEDGPAVAFTKLRGSGSDD
jgi:serine/threonine-protein kinase RsbW